MQPEQVYQDILALLEQQHVNYTVHEHTPSATYADAAAYLSFPLERLVKTIAFRTRSGSLILAALRGQDRVDYRKLAGALGAKRADIFSLSPQEVLETFGVEAGSVGPLLKAGGVQALFDPRISAGETIFCGIGRPDRTLEISLADLLRLAGGALADISKEEA